MYMLPEVLVPKYKSKNVHITTVSWLSMKLHTNKDTFLDHAFDLRKKIFKIVLHNFHHY